MSARLLRDGPQRLALIGVQPEQLDDYGGSLRAGIRRRIPEAVERGCEVLREWGVAVHERSAPLETPDLVGPQELSLPNYEFGKPQ